MGNCVGKTRRFCVCVWKLHIPYACLDASKESLSSGIYSLHRRPHWSWLAAQRSPSKRAKCARFPGLPQGPFRTKNSTALESVVFCYCRSFSLSVPFSSLFCLEKQAFLSPLRSVLLRPYRIFSLYRNSLSVVFLVRKGPLGSGPVPKGPSRTKNTMDSKFTIRSKFATATVKRYGGHFETTIFKGN